MADGGQIPRSLGDFNTFTIRVIPYLTNADNAKRLGVSEENNNKLVLMFGDIDTAGTWIYLWAKTSNDTTSTKPFRIERDEVKKSITSIIRVVYDDIPVRALTDRDRTTLLIPKRDTTPSTRPAITTRPELTITVQGGARFIVENRVKSDSSRASMHPDADYVELRYSIGETPPASADECAVTIIRSKAREILKLKPADARKNFYCYTRWANKTDEAKSGPWTRLHSAVISD
jgi:hypothetical protein